MLIFLSACLPTSPKSNRRSTASGSTGNTDPVDTSNEDIDFSGRRLYWFASGLDVEGTATINGDTQEVIYIRGEAIHTYLSNPNGSQFNYDSTFCLVASYNTSGVKKHVRARAVPIDFYNFSLQKKERLLRVDLPKSTENGTSCGGLVYQRDQFANPISGVCRDQNNANILVPAYKNKSDCENNSFTWNIEPIGTLATDIALTPSDLCLGSCSAKYTAENLSLFKVSANSIAETGYIPSSELDISTINLRFDLSNNTTDPVNQCDLSACQAKGFDCCLDGQCVNDGTLKPNANTFVMHKLKIKIITIIFFIFIIILT